MKTSRQQNAAQFRKLRRAQGRIKGVQPERSKAFLDFVRMHPCVCCQRKCRECVSRKYPTGCIGRGECVGVPVEAAHVGHTGKGMRVKCSDYETVPLCGQHHRLGKDSHHKLTKPGEFERVHGINLKEIWTELRRVWEAERAA